MITLKSEMKTNTVERLRGGEGCAHLKPLLSEMPKNVKLFNTITLDPGSSIAYHVHENETEIFYLLSGKARVSDDGVIHELTAGDSMATGHGHGHSVESIGEEPLVLLAAIVLH